MAQLQKRDKELTMQWDAEKKEIDYIKQLKQKIEDAQNQLENAGAKENWKLPQDSNMGRLRN